MVGVKVRKDSDIELAFVDAVKGYVNSLRQYDATNPVVIVSDEARFRELISALPLPTDVDRTLLRLTLLGAVNWTRIWYRPGKRTPAEIAHHLVNKILRESLD